MPSTVVAGPKLAAPRVSLLTSVDRVTHEDERFGGGVEFRPDGCGDGVVTPVGWNTSSLADSTPNDSIEQDAFVVWVNDKNTTFGWQVNEYQERSSRKLIATESYFVENQLWTNAASLTDFQNLADSAAQTITSGAVSPLHALMMAENDGGDTFLGTRFMIHARPTLVTEWASQGGIRREGNVWLTPTDNIVVPGRGYTGSSPDGDAATDSSEWIYVTGMITAHQGPVQALPDSVKEATNRQTNDITFYANRIFALVWDIDCALLAIEVDPSVYP